MRLPWYSDSRNAHAAANPEDGANALDAVISAFNAIAAMRQQMKPTWRVHGIIIKGGVRPNIIPNLTVTEWYARAPTAIELTDLKGRLDGCFSGAAMQTGCTCTIAWNEGSFPFFDLRTNSVMAERYRDNIRAHGIEFQTRAEDEAAPGGSTDMGNVSYIVPSIQPMFAIATPVGNHHPDFTATTGTPAAHVAALTTAKAMAETAVELLDESSGLLAAVSAEFESLGIVPADAKREMLGGVDGAGGVMDFWLSGDGSAMNGSYVPWVEPIA